MKCPNCKGDIQWGHRERTCPSCGEPLPTSQFILFEWGYRIVSFTEDRGFFFWLIVFAIVTFVAATVEHLIGKGSLGQLLDKHKFVSLIMFIYVPAHLKIIRNINSIVRPGYPGPYWHDRLVIKKMRRGTNYALGVGFLISLIVVGPFNQFSLLPAYFLVISLFTALFWSIESFRIDDREYLDAKVQSYFIFLGVKSLRRFRKTGGAFIISLVLSGGTFYGLLHVPNLYWNLRMHPKVMDFIDIMQGLFSWIPMLWPSQ